MTSCTISLEVTDYEPKDNKSIPFNDFEFRVRCDGITEEKLKLSEHTTNHIITNLHQIHRDIKFTIRIHSIKNNNLIGICDYIIPYSLIHKTQNGASFSHIKKSTVILLDTTKKQFFPNTLLSNCDIWFMINANVTVTACPSKRIMKSNSTNKQSKHEQKIYKRNNNTMHNNKYYNNTINANSNSNRTSLSFRYMPLSPKLEHHNKYKLDVDMHKQFAKIKTPPNGEVRGKRGFILDDTSNNNNKSNNTSNINNNTNVYSSNRNSTSRFSSGRKSKHTHTKHKHILPNNRKHKVICNNNTTTTIDDVPINDCSLFASEHYHEDVSTLGNINACINAHFVHFQNSCTPSTTPNNSISIPQSSDDILKYKLCAQLKTLQLYAKHHAMKIQYYTQRNSHLKQILTTAQTLYITEHQRNSNLRTQHQHPNTFDITRSFYNYPHITKCELKIFQHIFNKFYFEYDILRFKENANANLLNDHMKLNLLLKCVKALINSYGNVSGLVQSIPLAVRTKVKSFLVKHGIKEGNEVVNCNNMNGVSVYNNKIKAITEEDENEEEDERGSPLKEEEEIYKEVEKINKERKVKFKCVKGNVYKYGTQTVSLKMEKENLKVKGNKGRFVDIERFIALCEQSEMNMQSNRSKYNSRMVSPIYNKNTNSNSNNNSYSNSSNKHYSKIKYTKKKKT